MDKKVKVFFVIPTLFAGGAERVMSFISQNLDKRQFEASLIVIGFAKDKKFEITGIPVIYLNKSRISNAVLPIIKVIYKQKPSIIVSSISHLNIMMGIISIFFSKTKFIGRHATITNVAQNFKSKKSKFNIISLFNLDTFGIKKLDYIICQSSDMKDDFLKSYAIKKNNVKVIHNPITQVEFLKEKSKSVGIKRFITIGRLSKIKGQLRLLDVLSKLTIPFQFTIIGDGVDSNLISEKIKELNLIDKVKHIKHTNNVFCHLIEHDMFLQGSYSEGFPNALLESCVVGTPVIAFNVPGGTKEIVEDGINGFLVKDEEEFIKRLQDNREWNPEEVRASVFKKFNKDKIIGDYEQLLFDVLK